jgi:hypothetical protein
MYRKAEYMAFLSAHPQSPLLIPQLGECGYESGTLIFEGRRIPIQNPKRCRYFLAPVTLAEENRKTDWVRCELDLRGSRYAEKAVVAVLQDGAIIGMRDPDAPYFNSAEILLSDSIPADAGIETSGLKMTITVANRLTFYAKKGDPVNAGFLVANNESGPKPSLHIHTFLERLQCTNGAIMTSPLFSEKVSGRSLESFEMSLADFIGNQATKVAAIGNAVNKMAATPIGKQIKTLRARHRRLLAGMPCDSYTQSDSFWTFWNSVTASAKNSPNRDRLQVMAGNLIAEFAS